MQRSNVNAGDMIEPGTVPLVLVNRFVAKSHWDLKLCGFTAQSRRSSLRTTAPCGCTGSRHPRPLTNREKLCGPTPFVQQSPTTCVFPHCGKCINFPPPERH